jgi:hypothetical protein
MKFDENDNYDRETVNGLTEENFKIGQKVTCVKVRTSEMPDDDFWKQHLTVGKEYKITDIDCHFQNKIVVKSDNKKTEMFMPIELFVDVKYVRKLKLKKLKYV